MPYFCGVLLNYYTKTSIMMKSILTTILTLLAMMSFAQNRSSQKMLDALNNKKWFEAEKLYQKYHKTMSDNFSVWYYKASVSSAFNQPDSAEYYYQKLFNYKDSLSSHNYLFGVLMPYEQFSINLADFAKADELNQMCIDALKTDSTLADSATRAGLLKQFYAVEPYIKGQLATKQSAKSEPMTVVKTSNVGQVAILKQDSAKALICDAEWNGVKLRTLFDTGCSPAAYIWNIEIAKRMGLKMNEKDTMILNGTNIKALNGIIDSLKFGNVVVRNIPVLVSAYQIDKNDIKQVMCDSVMNSKFEITLGLPIIRQLGVMDVDVKNRQMTILDKMEQKPDALKNMYLESGNLFLNVSLFRNDYAVQFDTGGFMGFRMNSSFYDKNKRKLKTIPYHDDNQVHFTGGCNPESITHEKWDTWTNATATIGGDKIKIEDNAVSNNKGEDYKFGTDEGGSLGNGVFNDCQRAVFDFNNMIFTVY